MLQKKLTQYVNLPRRCCSNVNLTSSLRLFNNPSHSDITLTASDGTAYSAHLAILSQYTDFFATAVSKESGFTEAKSNNIAFPEHSSAGIKGFLEFCYTGSFTCSDLDECEEKMRLARLAVQVYLLADYVMADDVKKFAVKILKENSNMEPGGKLSAQSFRLLWVVEIGKIVDEVYGNTSDTQGHEEIRSVVVSAAVKGLGYWKMNLGMKEKMKKHGDFAVEVLDEYTGALRESMEESTPGSQTCTVVCKGCATMITMIRKPGSTWGICDITCPNPKCRIKIDIKWI